MSYHGEEHVSSSLRAEAHEYLSSDDIRPSPNPQQELSKTLNGVGVEEWPEIFHTLNSVRRLALHHGNLMGAHSHGVLTAVLKSVDNLRSAVSKNAILTITDMWSGMGKGLDPELVLVAPVLLKHFVNINGFLKEEADECLSVIILNASPARVLSAFLSSAGSKIPAVRSKAANVVFRCLEVMPDGKLGGRSRELDKLLAILPQFCQDRAGETRTAGRQIAALLINKGIVSDEKMQQVLPGDVYQRVEQSLRTGLFHTPAKRGGMGGLGNAVKVNASVDSTINMDDLEAAGTGKRGGGRRNGNNKGKGADFMVGSQMKEEMENLQELYKQMRGTDWKERLDAVNECIQVVLKNAERLANGGKLLQVFDRLCERLADGNLKVNAVTLEAMSKVCGILKDKLEGVLVVLVPALCGNLARTPKLVSLAKNAIDALTQNVGAEKLVGVYAQQIESGGFRVKSYMVQKLGDVAVRLCADGVARGVVILIGKTIVPVCVKVAAESKAEVKKSTEGLLLTLYSLLGDDLWAAMKEEDRGKMKSIVGVYE